MHRDRARGTGDSRPAAPRPRPGVTASASRSSGSMRSSRSSAGSAGMPTYTNIDAGDEPDHEDHRQHDADPPVRVDERLAPVEELFEMDLLPRSADRRRCRCCRHGLSVEQLRRRTCAGSAFRSGRPRWFSAWVHAEFQRPASAGPVQLLEARVELLQQHLLPRIPGTRDDRPHTPGRDFQPRPTVHRHPSA